MEPSFWNDVWKEGQIGFHQTDVNKNLKSFASKFKRKATILVPLCGKSKDMCFLNTHEHKVHGVEIVEKAIIEFQEENKTQWELTLLSEFKKYSSPQIDLYLSKSSNEINIRQGFLKIIKD